MAKILGLIYTAPSIVEPINKIVSEIMPTVEKINIVDDRILKIINKAEKITPAVYRTVFNYIRTAEDEGADAVLVTCSSISPCIDVIRPLISIPVMKIDDPMTDIAVQKASKIGVIATLKSTLEPTKNLLIKKANNKNKEISIIAELCEGAFEALSTGNVEKHDQLILDTIEKIAADVELIVLAQASMARLVPKISGEVSVPVLSSPRSGVEQAKEILGA